MLDVRTELRKSHITHFSFSIRLQTSDFELFLDTDADSDSDPDPEFTIAGRQKGGER